MNFLQDLYGNPMIHSIGWTLLHACWQITIVVLLLKLVLKTANSKSANMTYALSLFGLVVISVWSVHTFVNQYRYFDKAIKFAPIDRAYNTNDQLIVATGQKQFVEKAEIVKEEETNPHNWLAQIEQYLPLFVLAWMLGALLLVIRFIISWMHIRRLKRTGLHEIDSSWKNRLEALKQKMGFNKKISFYFSALVNEPVTMGHFKPIILIPIGMFANMSPEMVEAVLLHELAHIKRSDYLVNILQSLIEIIFFFHPGIWWISRHIRQSREHACDDIAVATCNDPLLYAQTLTTIQSSYFSTKNILAMSSTGKTGNFTTRIKRLFGYTETTSHGKKSVLFSSLAFTCLMALAFTQPFERTDATDLYPHQMTPDGAILFVIAPTTSQNELDDIKIAFAQQKVQLEYSSLKYTSFGLLEDIEGVFTMPDKSQFKFSAKKVVRVTMSLDWSRPYPLDVRPVGQTISVTSPDKKEKQMAHMKTPYTSSFDIPSKIGNVGFKKESDNRNVLTIDLPDNGIRFVLNGQLISKDKLLAKNLSPKEVRSMVFINSIDFEKKYNQRAPKGAYEIYAELNKPAKSWWPFKKDEDAHLKVHTFNVLHKAEHRMTENVTAKLGIEGGGISISADNCNDDNKAFQVLNDKIMSVPEGHCYPPTILALTEVDSFFILDEKVAAAKYGSAGDKGAYVYYYQHKENPEVDITDEYNIAEAAEATEESDVSDKYDITENDTASEVRFSKAIVNSDQKVLLQNVNFDNSCDVDVPLCFLNGQQLKNTTAGQWPEAIKAIQHFDSIVIILSKTAIELYGPEGKNDVWLFYKNQAKTELLAESESVENNLLYVINDEILFSEIKGQTPEVIKNIDSDRIQNLFLLRGKDATDKYGDLGKNGAMIIKTFPDEKPNLLAESLQVYPNPVADIAKIDFLLAEAAPTKIIVYDSWGRLITQLVDRHLEKGKHIIKWNTDNLPSGTYYIHVRAAQQVHTRAVILQKRS